MPSFEDRMNQKQRLKTMKAALTMTNFTLGDSKTEYKSANREAMKKADEYTYGSLIMNKDLKEAVKRSSVHFGNEETKYTSCSHEGFKDRATANASAERQKTKEDIAAQTAKLRKHNFSFGEEEIEYMSDQTRGYGSVPADAYGQRQQALPKIRETIQDSRSCHFSLGLDKINYQSNTHASHPGAPIDATRTESLKRIKAMKSALQTTAIVIGDDEGYM